MLSDPQGKSLRVADSNTDKAKGNSPHLFCVLLRRAFCWCDFHVPKTCLFPLSFSLLSCIFMPPKIFA